MLQLSEVIYSIIVSSTGASAVLRRLFRKSTSRLNFGRRRVCAIGLFFELREGHYVQKNENHSDTLPHCVCWCVTDHRRRSPGYVSRRAAHHIGRCSGAGRRSHHEESRTTWHRCG